MSDRRYAVRFTMFATLQRLQALKGRHYTWKEIAESAGVHVNTVTRVATNKTNRVDFETLTGLAAFFAKEGMPVELSDLMVMEEIRV